MEIFRLSEEDEGTAYFCGVDKNIQTSGYLCACFLFFFFFMSPSASYTKSELKAAIWALPGNLDPSLSSPDETSSTHPHLSLTCHLEGEEHVDMKRYFCPCNKVM